MKQLNIIPLAFWRVFLLILLATEYGMIVVYRNGRYDGFGALVFDGLVLVDLDRNQANAFVLSLRGLPVRSLGGNAVCAGVVCSRSPSFSSSSVGAFGWKSPFHFSPACLVSAGFFLVAAANGRLPIPLEVHKGAKNRHRCHFRFDPSWATHPLQLYSRRFQPTFSFFRRSHRVGSSSAPKQNQSAFGDLSQGFSLTFC